MHAHRCLRGASPFFLAVLAMALLGACNFPGGGTPEPGCDPSSLVAPQIPVPDSQVQDTLRPTFAWFYEGACAPDAFRVEAGPEGDFGSPQAVVGNTAAGATTWSPSTDLLPVTEYAWHVAAVSGSTIGPYSVTEAFWTGPVCDSPDLWPPSLISPDTGGWVTNPSPDLEWAYPETDCLQTSYKFEVSTDPGFSAAVISGQTGPWPSFATNLDFLTDCQTFFWRVAATWGEDIVGPYGVDYFHTQFGDTCVGQMELAVVAGTLWSDVCPTSGVCSGNPPAGCECIEGYVAADGVHQEGEVGIPGVNVRYGTGPCPASDWSADAGETDANGGYAQWVPAGIYCVWIDELEADNQALLQPGWWTRPIPYDLPRGYSITLATGEQRTDVDFFWQFAPPSSALAGIGGRVWLDADRDGVLDNGEPGIDGLEVWLSSGACDPSWSNRAGGSDPTTRTTREGRFGLDSGTVDAYQWDSLPDGDYCVVVDPYDGHFEDITGGGFWTFPERDAEIAMTTVQLRNGQDRPDVSFGWATTRAGIGGRLWRDADSDGAPDSNETGIEGVEVWLSSGACDPAWSNRAGGSDPTTRTNANGRFGLGSDTIDFYEWRDLPDGNYCVVVDPNDGHFEEIMGEGTWTYPVPDAEIAMTSVQMLSGQGRADVDFGWAAAPHRAGGVDFTASQNLNCRFGPATVYDVIGYLTAGETAAVTGRNSLSTWVQIQNPDRAGSCWVAVSGGTVAGDLSTVAVVASPPTPTPAPTVTPTRSPTPTPIDNQPPTVQVSHAPPGLNVNTAPVVFTATASDNVGVTRIRIYIQAPGPGSPTLVQTCNNTTTCTYTGGPYSGGLWSYFATAEDAALNLGTSGTKTFWVGEV